MHVLQPVSADWRRRTVQSASSMTSSFVQGISIILSFSFVLRGFPDCWQKWCVLFLFVQSTYESKISTVCLEVMFETHFNSEIRRWLRFLHAIYLGEPLDPKEPPGKPPWLVRFGCLKNMPSKMLFWTDYHVYLAYVARKNALQRKNTLGLPFHYVCYYQFINKHIQKFMCVIEQFSSLVLCVCSKK